MDARRPRGVGHGARAAVVRRRYSRGLRDGHANRFRDDRVAAGRRRDLDEPRRVERRDRRSRRTLSNAGRNDERAGRSPVPSPCSSARLSAGTPSLAVITTFVIALLCGLARGWVDVGPGFGVTILVTFSIAVALPAATVERRAGSRGVHSRRRRVGDAPRDRALAAPAIPPGAAARRRVLSRDRALHGSGGDDTRRRPVRSVDAHLARRRRANRARFGAHRARDLASRTVRRERPRRAVARAPRDRRPGLRARHRAARAERVRSPRRRRSTTSASCSRRHSREAAATMRSLATSIQSEIDLPRVTIGWDGTGLRDRERVDGTDRRPHRRLRRWRPSISSAR